MKHQYAAQLVLDKPGRGRVYGSILETIGNTPLVRIGRYAQQRECQAEVLAKLAQPGVVRGRVEERRHDR